MQNSPVIETPRLVLRHWREDDAGDLYRYASDSKVSELALWPCHTSEDMSREVIRNFFMPEPFTFAVALRDSGEVIGCIGLVPTGDEHFKTIDAEREVGYWIGRKYWGLGMTTEALEYLIEFLSDCTGIGSLLITTDARNIASQRVAEKCGFSHIGDYSFEGISSRAFRRILKQTSGDHRHTERL